MPFDAEKIRNRASEYIGMKTTRKTISKRAEEIDQVIERTKEMQKKLVSELTNKFATRVTDEKLATPILHYEIIEAAQKKTIAKKKFQQAVEVKRRKLNSTRGDKEEKSTQITTYESEATPCIDITISKYERVLLDLSKKSLCIGGCGSQKGPEDSWTTTTDRFFFHCVRCQKKEC